MVSKDIKAILTQVEKDRENSLKKDKDSSEIFDTIESSEQVITVTEDEEKKLNTESDYIQLEGTNFTFKVETNSSIKKIKLILVIIYGLVLTAQITAAIKLAKS